MVRCWSRTRATAVAEVVPEKRTSGVSTVPAVPTVHGPALVGDAGTLIDAHAHAWIDPPAGVAPEHALNLADVELQATALGAFAAAAGDWRGEAADGGEAATLARPAAWAAGLIDCQPPFAGRDANRLAELSLRSGVAIACVTGFHLARYYRDGRRPWPTSSAAADLFAAEVVTGLAETPGRRAAAIKAAHDGAVSNDLALWEAAVEAHKRTGACLLVHTERGAGAEDLVAWLLDRGVAGQSIYLCHVDKRPDLDLHLALAGQGVLLGYDTFLRPQYRPEAGVWPLLRAMVERGLGSAVAVCLDLAAPEQWREPQAGPAGYMMVARRLLRDLGAGEVLAGLLGGNVLGHLTRSEERGMTA